MRRRLVGVLGLALVAANARADVSAPPPKAAPAPARASARVRTRWPRACTTVEGTFLRGGDTDFRWRGADGGVTFASQDRLPPSAGLRLPLDGRIGAVARRGYVVELDGPGPVELGAICQTPTGLAEVAWTCTGEGCETKLSAPVREGALPLAQATAPTGFLWIPMPTAATAPRVREALATALFAEAQAALLEAAPGRFADEPPGEPVSFRAGEPSTYDLVFARGATRHELHCRLATAPFCTLRRIVGGETVLTYATEVSADYGRWHHVVQSITTPRGRWTRLTFAETNGSPGPERPFDVVTGDLLPLRD